MSPTASPLRRRAAALRRRWFVDLPTGLDHTVLLAGVARSGTTWLANLIDYRHDHRLIFEPFRPTRVPLVSGFARREYLRRSATSRRHFRTVERILTGRFRNEWTDQYVRRLFHTRRLVKTVRGNLLLPWIRESFPAVPIVLVLRHPCAVAASWLDLGWECPLAELGESPELREDLLGERAGELAAIEDPFLKVIYLWCLEVAVPLRGLGPGDAHLLFYEELVAEPEAELARLFRFLGWAWDPSVLALFDRPSSVSRSTSPVRTGGSRLTAWREKIGELRIGQALALLDGFGLAGLYDEGPRPPAGAAERVAVVGRQS